MSMNKRHLGSTICRKYEKKRGTFSADRNKTKIDFVLVDKENRKS